MFNPRSHEYTKQSKQLSDPAVVVYSAEANVHIELNQLVEAAGHRVGIFAATFSGISLHFPTSQGVLQIVFSWSPVFLLFAADKQWHTNLLC